MKFFLDTANLADIERWSEFGLVDGVTTNPTLLSREGCDPIEQLKKITEFVEGPVSAQVTCENSDDMVEQGRRLAGLADNIIVKIPATLTGLKAARALKEQGITLNITLTFDPAQAVPFLKINADYISLIIGRVEDFGLGAFGQTGQLSELVQRMGSTSKILVASLRNSHHLIEATNHGADVLTVPPATWNSIYQNPLTLSGEADFLAAWNNLPAELRKNYEL